MNSKSLPTLFKSQISRFTPPNLQSSSISKLLFPPEPPAAVATPGICNTARGNILENYVEYRLAKRYPNAYILRNKIVNVAPYVGFECDLLLYDIPTPPLLPPFHIIECKNYRGALTRNLIVDLRWRVKVSGAESGYLIFKGHISEPNILIAESLKINILHFNSATLQFESVTNPLKIVPFQYNFTTFA